MVDWSGKLRVDQMVDGTAGKKALKMVGKTVA